jgi:hypothetical protein
MGQYLCNGEILLDAGDDLQRPAAVFTNPHIDQKDPFQSLRPAHGHMRRGCLRALPSLRWLSLRAPPRGHDLRAQPMVGG